MASYEQMGVLLDEFGNLPTAPAEHRTFLEIAGFPHRESVWSNLLAFFLDPAAPHGLNSIFLDALLEEENLVEPLSEVKVEREVSTKAGKFIDLLISSNTHIIAIENKVFCPPTNPFPEYESYVNDRAKGRKICEFLLELRPTHTDNIGGFQRITYATLLRRIRSRLDQELGFADISYKVLLLDFFNTIDRLRSGFSNMTQEQLTFFRERRDAIDELLKRIKEVKKELRERKILPLKESLGGVERYGNVKQRMWVEDGWLDDTLVHEIRVSDELPIVVDTIVSAQGWRINVFLRPKGPIAKLKAYLDNLAISYRANTDDPERLSCGKFDYSEPPERIRVDLQQLIDKLATGQRSGRYRG